MTTYFDTLRGWLVDLGCAQSSPEALRARISDARPFWTLDYLDLEQDGWKAYLAADSDVSDEALTCKSVVVAQAIEAKMRRDLRHLEAALYVMTGPFEQEFPRLWAENPRYGGDTPEDLLQMAARVLSLCDQAKGLVHAVSTTYGLGDDPAIAAERAMARRKIMDLYGEEAGLVERLMRRLEPATRRAYAARLAVVRAEIVDSMMQEESEP